ncbi:MAG: alanine dehydrogenase [Planctomycetes bacterium]|nr:alanine dehydrogenase [Planctomycetota bacterium]
MIVSVPREIKADEYRVGLLPVGAELLARDGHTVLVERSAGLGSGFDDEAYAAAGATLVDGPAPVYARADLIVKVKEPQPAEMPQLRAGQAVFCYFHFAASRDLVEACLRIRIVAVAYETLEDAAGRLPLLTPMSEVAGKMSIQEGARCLEKPMMGRGLLLGGVAGVEPADVLILGGGVVGSNAARIAAGLGANVTVMDTSLDRLRYLNEIMPANVNTLYCDPHAVARHAVQADLVIGAVLIPGGRTPILISRELVAKMKKGAVIVDVCVDQGGCIETIHPTTHHDPTYIVDGVVHYGVTNIPGAVARTSSQALCNATLPYVRELAGGGLDAFIARDAGRARALNLRDGRITNPAVAAVFPDLPRA